MHFGKRGGICSATAFIKVGKQGEELSRGYRVVWRLTMIMTYFIPVHREVISRENYDSPQGSIRLSLMLFTWVSFIDKFYNVSYSLDEMSARAVHWKFCVIVLQMNVSIFSFFLFSLTLREEKVFFKTE